MAKMKKLLKKGIGVKHSKDEKVPYEEYALVVEECEELQEDRLENQELNRRSLVDLQRQWSASEEDLEAQRSALVQAEAEISAFEATVTELQLERAAACNGASLYTSELSQCRRDLAALEADCEAKNGRLGELSEDLAAATSAREAGAQRETVRIGEMSSLLAKAEARACREAEEAKLAASASNALKSLRCEFEDLQQDATERCRDHAEQIAEHEVAHASAVSMAREGSAQAAAKHAVEMDALSSQCRSLRDETATFRNEAASLRLECESVSESRLRDQADAQSLRKELDEACRLRLHESEVEESAAAVSQPDASPCLPGAEAEIRAQKGESELRFEAAEVRVAQLRAELAAATEGANAVGPGKSPRRPASPGAVWVELEEERAACQKAVERARAEELLAATAQEQAVTAAHELELARGQGIAKQPHSIDLHDETVAEVAGAAVAEEAVAAAAAGAAVTVAAGSAAAAPEPALELAPAPAPAPAEHDPIDMEAVPSAEPAAESASGSTKPFSNAEEERSGDASPTGSGTSEHNDDAGVLPIPIPKARDSSPIPGAETSVHMNPDGVSELLGQHAGLAAEVACARQEAATLLVELKEEASTQAYTCEENERLRMELERLRDASLSGEVADGPSKVEQARDDFKFHEAAVLLVGLKEETERRACECEENGRLRMELEGLAVARLSGEVADQSSQVEVAPDDPKMHEATVLLVEFKEEAERRAHECEENERLRMELARLQDASRSGAVAEQANEAEPGLDDPKIQEAAVLFVEPKKEADRRAYGCEDNERLRTELEELHDARVSGGAADQSGQADGALHGPKLSGDGAVDAAREHAMRLEFPEMRIGQLHEELASTVASHAKADTQPAPAEVQERETLEATSALREVDVTEEETATSKDAEEVACAPNQCDEALSDISPSSDEVPSPGGGGPLLAGTSVSKPSEFSPPAEGVDSSEVRDGNPTQSSELAEGAAKTEAGVQDGVAFKEDAPPRPTIDAEGQVPAETAGIRGEAPESRPAGSKDELLMEQASELAALGSTVAALCMQAAEAQAEEAAVRRHLDKNAELRELDSQEVQCLRRELEQSHETRAAELDEARETARQSENSAEIAWANHLDLLAKAATTESNLESSEARCAQLREECAEACGAAEEAVDARALTDTVRKELEEKQAVFRESLEFGEAQEQRVADSQATAAAVRAELEDERNALRGAVSRGAAEERQAEAARQIAEASERAADRLREQLEEERSAAASKVEVAAVASGAAATATAAAVTSGRERALFEALEAELTSLRDELDDARYEALMTSEVAAQDLSSEDSLMLHEARRFRTECSVLERQLAGGVVREESNVAVASDAGADIAAEPEQLNSRMCFAPPPRAAVPGAHVLQHDSTSVVQRRLEEEEASCRAATEEAERLSNSLREALDKEHVNDEGVIGELRDALARETAKSKRLGEHALRAELSRRRLLQELAEDSGAEADIAAIAKVVGRAARAIAAISREVPAQEPAQLADAVPTRQAVDENAADVICPSAPAKQASPPSKLPAAPARLPSAPLGLGKLPAVPALAPPAPATIANMHVLKPVVDASLLQ